MIIIVQATEDPFVTIEEELNFDVEAGASFSVVTLIKPQPNATTDFRVTASVSDSKLSICNVRILEVGRDLGCIDSAMEANYTVWAGSDEIYQTGFVQIPKVTNFGKFKRRQQQ